MKVLVVYHTIYGHTLQLARAVTEGVKSVAGVEAVFRRAPEFPHTEKELEAGEGYALPVYLAMIASCTGFGQAWYCLNSMLKVARPCVLDRTTVA